MKSYLNIVVFVFFSLTTSAQGAIDTLYDSSAKMKERLNNDIESWPNVMLSAITDNGKYFGYITNKIDAKNRILTILDISGNWKIESTIVGSYLFTANSSKAIWINTNDSLCIVSLGTSKIYYVQDVLLFSIAGNLLTYKLKHSINERSIFSLFIDSLSYFRSDNFFLMSDAGDTLIISEPDIKGKQIVSRMSRNGQVRVLMEISEISTIVKDDERKQVAFFSRLEHNRVWYYSMVMDTVIPFKLAIDSSIYVSGVSHFSENGELLFLRLTERRPDRLGNEASPVNVWSYLDSKLYSLQANELSPREYTASLHISDQKLLRLDEGNDWLFLPKLKDTIALIRQQEQMTMGDEANWNSASKYSWYLLSLNSYRKRRLDDICQNTLVQISPSGKYVIFYDKNAGEYFVYDTRSGIKRNVTNGIIENWEKDIDSDSYGRHIAGWEDGDAWVFINGYRDIWQIDPEGRKVPINLTNGYGNLHNTIFFFALQEYAHRCFHKGESLVLSAFNLDTKYNGFYKKVAGRIGEPDSLTMGPVIYNIVDNPNVPSGVNYSPIKATNSDAYVVRRMSATEAPNYFFTKDFRAFKALSNLQPQKKYNWYTAELHSWQSLDKRILQGILYKPESFDSSKRYPVIFYFYERKSDGVNAYLTPGALENGCAINVPYYVSNGYLVFCPDIYYKRGDPMQGSYDAVISAVNYIRQVSYVDSTKIGIQGCSWGALQTNYLVTHSSVFAAACSASAIGNWISSYGSIMRSGESMQGMYEIGQFRVGATLWQKRQIYIKNSAIFNVGEVVTPLLLMHTEDDAIFPFSNILQFYSGLRFFKKKSWMLVYKGNHGVFGADALDFSTRMKQFFDYYLRSFPKPIWMR